MRERQIIVNDISMNVTFWDYVQAFSKVLYYNNTKQKHTWFIKICTKVFEGIIPNWFLDWWSYHGPTIKILPDNYFQLYQKWKIVSPYLENLYKADHLCYPDEIDQRYFFLEFSIPWIHKWIPEFGYTDNQIPCLYRTFYNNFWEGLLKIDKETKVLKGQTLLDQIQSTIESYETHQEQKK